MDWSQKLYFTGFLIVAAAIHGIHGYATVSGTVFCDQCKDGQISLFDYPLNGINVAMACPDNNGQMTTWGEETTNWLGNFVMKFDGNPDLSGCVAQATSSNEQGNRGCGTGGGPGKSPRLIFRMFEMNMYTIDPLISQPANPMSFCPKFSYPQPHPNPVTPATPPSTLPFPPTPPLPPLPSLLPPMPRFPYLEASACSHQTWMMPEYRCYWKVINPDSKVGVVFGVIAARKYGADITLWEGMRGRGEPYKTLLREGTTALLNSYNSLQFPYHPLSVIQHMNWALMGSTQQVMHTALSFLRANSGNGRVSCNFNPCNSVFKIEETTIKEIHQAFAQGKLTARELVDFYLHQIETLNPLLRGVIEVNPEVQNLADEADRNRAKSNKDGRFLGDLHGIPVLLKDTIGTKDKLNTTAGSYALLGSEVPRDAGVVEKLRNAGAIILGKASLSEWYKFRSLSGVPNGWCARSGQGVNPYCPSGSPCGSSSGCAISVAANMTAVSLGTETHSSIICPADHNSVVGLKPTVGVTSQAGIIPMTPLWDTVGPICRNVTDAVYMLDVIVQSDPRDDVTMEAAKYIPEDGYKQFLKDDGLKGKRIGIVRHPFVEMIHGAIEKSTFEHHLDLLRQEGAILIDNLRIAHIEAIMDPHRSGEMLVMMVEFRTSINAYLKELITSPVRSLADIIAFNERNSELEKLTEYDQHTFIEAEKTDGYGEEEKKAVEKLKSFSQNGFEKMMKDHELDAMISPGSRASPVFAIGGYPAITIPAGYESDGMPFGICFGGLKGTEPKLIEIAYAFEQSSKVRRPPSVI